MVSPPSAPAKSQMKGIAIKFEMRPLGCFKFQRAEIFSQILDGKQDLWFPLMI